MSPVAIVSSVVASVVVIGAWWQYLASIPKEKVPRRPVGTLVAMAIGGTAAAVALVAAALQSSIAVVPAVGLAVTALALAGFFVHLLRQAPLPDGKLVVAVGDKLPPFTALDGSGTLVRSADWSGRRTLLKFFRGHW